MARRFLFDGPAGWRRQVTGDIAAGRILVRLGTPLPNSFRQPDVRSHGWSLMAATGPAFQAQVLEAGMTFFFMAGVISASAFGFDREKTLASAMNRLALRVHGAQCNSLEIAAVSHHSFLGVPFVRVSGHARHLQVGSFFQPDPVT